MRVGRQFDDERAEREAGSPRPSPDRDAVLTLQQGAGNAAVAQLLQRDDIPSPDAPSFSPVKPGSLLKMRPEPSLAPTLPASYWVESNAATWAVLDWFDKAANEITAGRSAGFFQSVAELVKSARELSYKTESGKTGKVADMLSADVVEAQLRDRAKLKGVRLLEHRDPKDPAGVRSETMAILGNLGKIPTSITLGGDSAKITASIAGKVTGEVAVGKGKLEAEGSAEGGEATYTLPGGKTKITGKGGPEGGGAAVEFPGGKVSIDITAEKVKAEVKAGDFITVRGSAGTEKEGGFAWKAEITIGTLGKIITADEVAKLMIGAQDTFGKAASDLAAGIDPEKVKKHGSAVKDAVTAVAEKAQKSAKQNKPGWSVGAELKGSETGGVSGMITFTWVF